MSASPGAPQSAQTSFPGICRVFLSVRAALSVSDISTQVFPAQPRRCSGGSTAQPLQLRRVLPGSAPRASPHRYQPPVQDVKPGSPPHLPASWSLLTSWGCGWDESQGAQRRVNVLTTLLQEVKSWGCPNSLFRIFPLFDCTCAALQPRTRTETHSAPHSCNICRGSPGLRLERGALYGPGDSKTPLLLSDRRSFDPDRRSFDP